MTAALVLQMIGGAGFLAGIAALLHFFNTWKSTRSKGSSEAYQAYQAFVNGATGDRDREIERLRDDRDLLRSVRALIIDLVLDLIDFARSKGATAVELDPFQDRLDELRRR